MTAAPFGPGLGAAFANRSSPVEFHVSLALTRHRRRQDTLRTHRPSRRRLRIATFAGFPVPALIARCACCSRIWPCRELISTLRETIGWTRSLTRTLKRLRKEPP